MTTFRYLSLFTGIGGFELGLRQGGGHRPAALCENWEPAKRVLRRREPGVHLYPDVAGAIVPDDADGIVAGFPCTDLSLAGSMDGIGGDDSGLVDHVLRLAEDPRVRWVLLENVPHMLVLHGGVAMRHITTHLEHHGYDWAYRVVDSRFSGVPQRRRRVLLLASRDPSLCPIHVLLADDAGEPRRHRRDDDAFGFYWTEGRWGPGLVHEAIPTLKGGSTIGLPSAPAVWFPTAPRGSRFVIPGLVDGERLQGFRAGRTTPAAPGRWSEDGIDHRWKLVGNAVTVGVARWVGERLANPKPPSADWAGDEFDRHATWPTAAALVCGRPRRFEVSEWPTRSRYTRLSRFVDPSRASPLSAKAASGYLSRVEESNREMGDQFELDLRTHIDHTLRRDAGHSVL